MLTRFTVKALKERNSEHHPLDEGDLRGIVSNGFSGAAEVDENIEEDAAGEADEASGPLFLTVSPIGMCFTRRKATGGQNVCIGQFGFRANTEAGAPTTPRALSMLGPYGFGFKEVPQTKRRLTLGSTACQRPPSPKTDVPTIVHRRNNQALI